MANKTKTTTATNEATEAVSATVTTSLETGDVAVPEIKQETVSHTKETTLAPCEVSLCFFDDPVISDASDIL